MDIEKYAQEIAELADCCEEAMPSAIRVITPILARLAAEARREGAMSVCDYLDKHMDNSSALYWLPIIGRLAHADAPKENK